MYYIHTYIYIYTYNKNNPGLPSWKDFSNGWEEPRDISALNIPKVSSGEVAWDFRWLEKTNLPQMVVKNGE